MPTLILNNFWCCDPRGIKDKYLMTLDKDYHEGRRPTIWGPEEMRKGHQIDLTRIVDPIEFLDYAKVYIYNTQNNRHDYRGRIFAATDRILSEHGSDFTEHTYSSQFPSILNSEFIITSTILPNPIVYPYYTISLESLVCNNPQGTKDEIRLKVNDRTILGPGLKMRKNQHEYLDNTLIEFRDYCRISLSDSQGQDWSSSFILRGGFYNINTPEPEEHVFDVDNSSITGDAQYTLYYRMLI